MRLIVLTIIGLGWALGAFAREHKVCPDILLQSGEALTFSETERNFLCGDPKNPPWSRPPENQARLFLISFLQARGYYQPTFTRDGEVLVVDVGPKSRIKVLAASDAPPQLDIKRFWVPSRFPLTPSLLDEYQALVRGRLESEGYPCPQVKALAHAEDMSMVVMVEAGPRQKITRITEEEVPGLRPRTLRRYYPFSEGDWFNGDLVNIANERIKAEDMLTSTYFVSRCGEDGADVSHRAMAGPARKMTVGFGVNTETYFLVRSTYRNARVDANASRFDAVLSVNYFQQRVESSFDWYFLPHPSALHLRPRVAYERRKEKSADEERTTTGSLHLGIYRDGWGHQWRVYAGPNLNLVQTFRPSGLEFARILELEASGRVMSHDFELYRGAPRSGHVLDWRVTTASKRTFSTITVNTHSLRGEQLFNWAGLEPPLLVLGIRGGWDVTEADPRVKLPDSYVHFLGGSEDVRGFPRRTIPSQQSGARTTAFVGTEARLVTVIPYNVQPFVFLDAGQSGPPVLEIRESEHARGAVLEPPIYYSPGLGVRWQSPVGSLRGTVARGFIANDRINRGKTVPAGWTFFVSFGEEF